MKKSSLNKVSDKQKIELGKRRLLKYQLFNEQGGLCAKCQRIMTYYNEAFSNYPHLHHKKRLSAGGKTERKNCEVLCSECHSNKEHNLRNKYGEQPVWNK